MVMFEARFSRKWVALRFDSFLFLCFCFGLHLGFDFLPPLVLRELLDSCTFWLFVRKSNKKEIWVSALNR